MGNLRTFRALPVLFLLLGIFASSVMAEVCFCGEACSLVSQEDVKKKVSFPFHNHCVGSLCRSCSFEDGQTLKAGNSTNHTRNLDLPDTTLFVSTPTACLLNNHILKSPIVRIYASEKVQSSPTYLQNCSLLC